MKSASGHLIRSEEIPVNNLKVDLRSDLSFVQPDLSVLKSNVLSSHNRMHARFKNKLWIHAITL